MERTVKKRRTSLIPCIFSIRNKGVEKVWTPTQGDFLEYEMTFGEAQYIARMQIKEVTSTTMKINTTWTMVGGILPTMWKRPCRSIRHLDGRMT
jgi:hypothetical protein